MDDALALLTPHVTRWRSLTILTDTYTPMWAALQRYPGDDPYWEAVDLWYWATNDQEWYDPGQVTTTNGSLKILIENTEWKGLPYRSGMLQSWNKFCFTGGYIEVSITLPGPDQNTQGYVSPFTYSRRLLY